MTIEFKGWDHCHYCGKEMSSEDVDAWNPKMCCGGHECGCMGKPIEPPCCIACAKEE